MRFEKILFLILLINIGILIMIQIAHTVPQSENILISGDNTDGAILGKVEYLFKKGYMVLKVDDMTDTEKLKILINGDETAFFDSSTIKIDIMNGDVVEIDNNLKDKKIKVSVIMKSNNVLNDCLNTSMLIKHGINRLLKVRLD
jgi:hypothetical protein